MKTRKLAIFLNVNSRLSGIRHSFIASVVLMPETTMSYDMTNADDQYIAKDFIY